MAKKAKRFKKTNDFTEAEIYQIKLMYQGGREFFEISQKHKITYQTISEFSKRNLWNR